MLRLTILLILAMAVAWATLGRDNGQLRPGLAQAAAEGRLDEVWAAAKARETAAEERRKALAAAATTAAVPKPRATPAPAPAIAEPAAPAPVVMPERQVVQVLQDPVFTLEAFGNELVPGEDQARAVAPAPVAPVEPEAPAVDQGRVWYVNADSVNVRAAPSTDADILGKLNAGEALLMVAAVDDEWARIVIQGDGVEGYVATRFLSPAAP